MSQVTIASATIPNWQGNTLGVVLRIYNNASFSAQSGTIYPQSMLTNPAGLGTFFQAFTCTVSGGSLVIPAITLDSTTDSPDNPQATYTAVIYATSSGQPVQTFGTTPTFYLNPAPTSTTWQAIYAAEGSL